MAQTKVKLISDGVIVQGNLHASHGITTAHIGEGSNLYYTDARVGSYLSSNGYATQSTIVAAITDSAPSTLDTLNELAAALGDDANFSTTVTNSIALKAPLASPAFTGAISLTTSSLPRITLTRTGILDWYIGNPSQGTSNNFTIGTNSGGNTEILTLTNTGYVGIGTTSPDGNLEVVGTKVISTASDGVNSVLIGLSGSNRTTIQFDTADTTHTNRQWGLTNIAGDFYMGRHGLNVITMKNDGKVGIGTSSPEGKLDVRAGSGGKIVLGSYDANYKVVVEGGDQLNFYNGTSPARAYINYGYSGTPGDILLSRNLFIEANSNGGTTGTVRIKSDGKVGIGTTSPGNLLDVAGDTDINGQLFVTHDANYVAKIKQTATSMSNGAYTFEIDSTSHTSNMSTAGAMSVDVNSGRAFTINGQGNVGIGTISPTKQLHLKRTSGDVRGIMVETTVATSYAEVQLKAASEFRIGTGGSSTVPNGQFYVYDATAGAHRFDIDANGNVGIGTTSPGRGLTINKDNEFASLEIIKNNSGNQIAYLGTGSSGASDLGILQLKHNNTIAVQLYSGGDSWLNGGNVGIGTTSPNNILHVSSAGSDTYVRIGNNAGYDAGLYFNTSTDWTIGTDTSNSNAFTIGNGSSVGANSKIVIRTNGEVGIGTTSPGAKLDISGVAGGTYGLEISTPERNRALFFYNSASTSDAGYLGIKRGSVDTLNHRLATSGNSALCIGTGNVGIGTDYPSGKLNVEASGNHLHLRAGTAAAGKYWNFDVTANNQLFIITNNNNGINITSAGNVGIGVSAGQNAGKLQIQSGVSENGGILDIADSGNYRYYSRVCRNATTSGSAGYWHIKTNIPVNSGTMFLAKFYGYIYGSSQILDLQHCGYAYAASNTVINQNTTNNGSNANASSTIYASSSGNKVTFRIAFGSGATFSTYFCGVTMDIAFLNPAGAGHDFEIEAQAFSQSSTIY